MGGSSKGCRADLPASATRPLQLNQNAAVRLVFNQLKLSHTTPPLNNLHRLPAAQIWFKSQVQAYLAANVSGAPYIQDMVETIQPILSAFGYILMVESTYCKLLRATVSARQCNETDSTSGKG